jgi:hypothetical protein
MDQLGEVSRPLGVARNLLQLPFRPHLPLDARAGVGEQGFQDGLSRLLVQPMPGIGLG